MRTPLRWAARVGLGLVAVAACGPLGTAPTALCEGAACEEGVIDGGEPNEDATLDGSGVLDGSTTDGSSDGGGADSGTATVPDGGIGDSGVRDASTTDGGIADSGVRDSATGADGAPTVCGAVGQPCCAAPNAACAKAALGCVANVCTCVVRSVTASPPPGAGTFLTNDGRLYKEDFRTNPGVIAPFTLNDGSAYVADEAFARFSLSGAIEGYSIRGGVAYAWGSYTANGLGTASTYPSIVKRFDGGDLDNVVSLFPFQSGRYDGCVRRADRSTWCFGPYNQNTTAQPLYRDGVGTLLLGIKTLTSPYRPSCALLDDASVWCRGARSTGFLGNGTSSPGETTIFSEVSSLGTSARDVRSVDQTACAILDSGEVTCWGNNDRGFLARGDIGGFDALAGRSRVKLVGGVTLAGAVEFVGAPTVYQQFCAKLADGRYACWGNSYGALSFASIVKRDDNQQPFFGGISQVMSTGAYVDSDGVLRRSFQYNAGGYIADTAQRAPVYTTVCPSIP